MSVQLFLSEFSRVWHRLTLLRKSFRLSLFTYSSLKIARRRSSSVRRSASMEVMRWVLTFKEPTEEEVRAMGRLRGVERRELVYIYIYVYIQGLARVARSWALVDAP